MTLTKSLQFAGPTLFIFLLILERFFPQRRAVEPGVPRVLRNLTIYALSFGFLWIEWKLLLPLSFWISAKNWGILSYVPMPKLITFILGILLLDYTLYLRHRFSHTISFYWRFHQIHHADLDMDVSTALRFHCGELLFDIPWRFLQVILIGVGPELLAMSQAIFSLEILFIHCNIRIPIKLETWLGKIIVTPMIHRLHHSQNGEYCSSNFSTGFTLWDCLHQTLSLQGSKERFALGLAAHQDRQTATFRKMLTLPFQSRGNAG